MGLVRVGAAITVSTEVGSDVSLAGLDDGRFMVVWEGPFVEAPDDFGPRNYNEVLGRTYSSAGSPLTGAVVVNTLLRDPQFDPDVEATADGGFAVTYVSGVEDSVLPFLGLQRFTADGGRIGAESFSGDYSLYYRNPDLVALNDGSLVVATSEEFNGEAYRVNGDGVFGPSAFFGWDWGSFQGQAAAAFGATGSVLFSRGYGVEPDDDEGVFGVYAHVRETGGAPLSAPILLTALNGSAGDPGPLEAVALHGGRIAVTWTDVDGGGAAVVKAAVFDAASRALVAAPLVLAGGDVGAPKLDALDDGRFVVVWDGPGDVLAGRVVTAEGAAAADAFTLDGGAGAGAPDVAATADGEFVVAWTAADGVKAQQFEFVQSSGSPLLDRPGVLDGSAAADQLLAGTAGRNTFYFDVTAASGHDRITGFAPDDLLVVNRALADADGDGMVTFGRNRILDLDGPGGESDTVRIEGVDGLRWLGQRDGLHVYGDAAVRPDGAIEGTLNDDVLAGDAGDRRTDVFFFDTAAGVPLGADRIAGFGGRDLLVTTTPVFDPNDDGLIRIRGVLTLSGPEDSGFEGRPGTVALSGIRGDGIRRLEFDGAVEIGGVEYFVYSLKNTAAGLDLLLA